MKKNNLIRLMLSGSVVIALAVNFNSCKKEKQDPCEGITCQNGGWCYDGSCKCTLGYEGTNCETESRAKFIGSDSVSSSCSVTKWKSTIASTSVTKLTLKDLYGFPGINVNADLTSSTEFNIPLQTVSDGASHTIKISGSGSISGNTITALIKYIDIVGNICGTANCSVTCTETWKKL
jgi:hypothetical protein